MGVICMDNKTLGIVERCKYYMENYDCVFTYIQDEGKTQQIIDPTDKICRFCGKRYPEVKFKKKAHAISELIGNKEFVLRNECDTCNKFFGDKLEDDLGKYLGLGRTLSQIAGKDGVPSYKSKDGKCRIDFTNKGLVIQEMKGNTCMEEYENYLIFHAVRDTYTPVAVYKALVKMALSLIPYEKMPFFFDTVAWLKEESHVLSKYDMTNYEYMIERYIPGPRPLKLRASGFIRKNDSLAVPYYQFLLEFSNYSYQIMVPCKAKDGLLDTVGEVDFIPIPGADEVPQIVSVYGDATMNLRDMSGKAKVKNDPLDICLSFEKCEKYGGSGETVTEILGKEGIKLKKRL